MLEYKRYLGRVEFDDDAGVLYGEVVNTRDVITFQGTSADEVREAFHASVDDYLAFCAERGEEPKQAYSNAIEADTTTAPRRRPNWKNPRPRS
jgi:predicted HicB family RNase H-like nuclease